MATLIQGLMSCRDGRDRGIRYGFQRECQVGGGLKSLLGIFFETTMDDSLQC